MISGGFEVVNASHGGKSASSRATPEELKEVVITEGAERSASFIDVEQVNLTVIREENRRLKEQNHRLNNASLKYFALGTLLTYVSIALAETLDDDINNNQASFSFAHLFEFMKQSAEWLPATSVITGGAMSYIGRRWTMQAIRSEINARGGLERAFAMIAPRPSAANADEKRTEIADTPSSDTGEVNKTNFCTKLCSSFSSLFSTRSKVIDPKQERLLGAEETPTLSIETRAEQKATDKSKTPASPYVDDMSVSFVGSFVEEHLQGLTKSGVKDAVEKLDDRPSSSRTRGYSSRTS